MKTQHHTYEEGKGFWIKEVRFEIVSHFIVKEMEEEGVEGQPQWYFDLYDNLLDISKEHFQDYACLALTDLSQFKLEREEVVNKVLENTIKRAELEGEFISIEQLNRLELENKDWGGDTITEWIGKVYTEDILFVLNTLIKMLKHEWHEDINIELGKKRIVPCFESEN